MSVEVVRTPRHYFFGRRCRGFTLLELMAAIGVAALLAAVAIPSYRKIMDDQKTRGAIGDIGRIAMILDRYRVGHDTLPGSLSQLSGIPAADPWGHPYEYLNLLNPNGGTARKDHNLHPINTFFDLYSKGPDGDSNAPLTAHASRDDIIYANDGQFVGIAADY